MGIEDPDRTKIAPTDPLIGVVLDRRYRIDFRIAAGGFGAIYQATQLNTGLAVALKVLHGNLATQADVVARFRREGATLAQLRSKHTVTAYEFGQADGSLYIAMELLQGESLYECYRKEGALPWRRLARIMRQVCSSLAEAHALGVVHRDLKPTNIHLEDIGGDPDFVKVLDFGIAKILHGSSLGAADLTKSGHVVGTFEYMAPEQMVGAQTSGQTDIYTLGIVMYQMLTDERPFGAQETQAKLLTAMLTKKPTPIGEYIDCPPDLEALVERCLEREPDKRYRDVLELGDDLDRLLLEGQETRVVKAPTRPSTDEILGGDSSTWIDQVPPSVTPEAPSPATTLPGIAPPQRNTPWPVDDPRKKR